jgi:hypothetical protein
MALFPCLGSHISRSNSGEAAGQANATLMHRYGVLKSKLYLAGPFSSRVYNLLQRCLPFKLNLPFSLVCDSVGHYEVDNQSRSIEPSPSAAAPPLFLLTTVLSVSQIDNHGTIQRGPSRELAAQARRFVPTWASKHELEQRYSGRMEPRGPLWGTGRAGPVHHREHATARSVA